MKRSNRLLMAITVFGALMSCSYAADYAPDELRAMVHQCGKDDAKSCGKLTNYYFQHNNLETDVSYACEFAEKSCLLGNLKDCPIASSEVCHNPDTTDPASNVKYWELGCKGNDAESCVALAKVAKKDKEYVKTIELYDKACRIDKTDHRTKACEELDKLYNHGYGLKENPKEMKVIFRKACAQKKQKACRSLSRISDSF